MTANESLRRRDRRIYAQGLTRPPVSLGLHEAPGSRPPPNVSASDALTASASLEQREAAGLPVKVQQRPTSCISALDGLSDYQARGDTGDFCSCPECAGKLRPTDAAYRSLQWAMLEARQQPGLSDFWVGARVADTFARSVDMSQQQSLNTAKFLDHELRRGMPHSALRDSCYSLALRSTGPWVLALETLTCPFGVASDARRCCPEGPPKIAGGPILPTGPGSDTSGITTYGSGKYLTWDVTVKARWLEDDKGCDCTCCEFRVFVAFRITEYHNYALPNPEDRGGVKVIDSKSLQGAYQSSSDSPQEPGEQGDNETTAYTIDGRTFVEDATFEDQSGSEVDVIDLADTHDLTHEDFESESGNEPRFKFKGRPGSEQGGDSLNTPCSTEWHDMPRVYLHPGVMAVVHLEYIAVIRPAGCPGATAWSRYTLTGAAVGGDNAGPVKGDEPRLTHGETSDSPR